MARNYLVDGYNLILRDRRYDDLVAESGLAEARRVLRHEAEAFARREGCVVRVVYDGTRGPHDHHDRHENRWVQEAFSSRGEEADGRVVAAALQLARAGETVVVVSDDESGVRGLLRGARVTLMTTREFARRLRDRGPGHGAEPRESALSADEKSALEQEFLARDAERRAALLESRKKRRPRG
jgi:predicted RNA-binding protein with PIN domain